MEPLFVDIARFIQDVCAEGAAHIQANGDGPTSKKRKLDLSHDSEIQGDGSMYVDWASDSHSVIKDISFSIPQRKKLTLEIGKREDQGLRARNPPTGEVEFVVSWKDIRECSYDNSFVSIICNSC